MENAVKELVKDQDQPHRKSSKWFTNWKLIAVITIVMIVLTFGAISYYQANHFNQNIFINGIDVGGLTADEALQTLKTSSLKNEVYIGKQQILDGKDTKMGFTIEDLSNVEKLLKKQQTIFPSFKEQQYSLIPLNPDPYRNEEMKALIEEKLIEMNTNLKAPQDATVHLENGQIVVSKSADGEQYDIASLLKEYEEQKYNSEIHLNPVYIQPIREDSEFIQNAKETMQSFLQQTVEYEVQDKKYPLEASELIQNASITKDMNITFDTEGIQKKVAEINDAQSTLGKDFEFKTHSGSVISVKGEGYGWALDVEKETALIKEAFENGTTSVSASNISGRGWQGEGYGYETLANNGIGDTYAEVSLDEQRMWIYRDGELVFTTNIVTGNQATGEVTSKGVWYVLYKRTDYVLTGQRVGSSTSYASRVDYWVPFTNPGQGFHDAGWRKDWSSTAYLTDGSAGCINVLPSVMKQVYDNLNVYDPVIVY